MVIRIKFLSGVGEHRLGSGTLRGCIAQPCDTSILPEVTGREVAFLPVSGQKKAALWRPAKFETERQLVLLNYFNDTDAGTCGIYRSSLRILHRHKQSKIGQRNL